MTILGACLLSACANDDFDAADKASTQQEQAYIGFSIAEEQIADSTAMPNQATRATEIITSDNITDTDFMVYAFKQNGEAYMGNNDTEWGNKGTQIYYGNDAWEYKNATEKKKWPSEALDFYAVSPSLEKAEEFCSKFENKNSYPYNWKFNNSTKQIQYTFVDEYGIDPTNKPANIDVMYAVKKNQTKDSDGGKVQFQFKHILSQLEFYGMADPTDKHHLDVEINYIKLHNVRTSGTFTIPDEGNATTDNWSTEALSKTNDIGIRHEDTGTITFDADAKEATKLSGPLLLIPQTLNGWEVGTSIKTANTKLQCYLEINCKVKWYGNLWGTPHYWIGKGTQYEKIYMPFSATLKPGCKYKFTIIFGGGYDKDGDKNTTTFLD